MDDLKKEESTEVEETKVEESQAEVSKETAVETPEGAHLDEEGILEYDDSNASKIDKFFGVTKYGSSVKTEIIAGLVTFLSMCYILTLNPNIIAFGGGQGQLWASIFIATAIGAIIGTLLMAFVAKMPFAQASGLGLNSMIALLLGGVLVFGKPFSFGTAMLLVLISGVLFLVVSLVPIGKDKETGKFITLREKIFDGMPIAVRKAISVGIGLFIAFIGLQNAGVIVASESTKVTLVAFNNPDAWGQGGVACGALVALFGFIVIAVLSHFKVKGAIIIGMLAATLLAWPLGVTSWDIISGDGGYSWKFWENFANYFKSPEEGGVFLAAFRDVKFPDGSFMSCIMVIITFCMIDMFDTMGTVVGCATNAGLVDKNGKPHNYNKIMISDSVATAAGALLGTSTVTTFVESGSGIAAGGKTGLTALSTACLFFLAIFLLPVFAFIPSAACASALLYVGVLMMANVKDIDFRDPLNAVPAFVTIIMMPLAYSITTGIGMGILTYVIINCTAYLVKLCLFKAGKIEEKPVWNISVVALVITALFLVYFFVPVSF
ncbi:MAG: NCS2 family permease [Acholeplasmatales bacterium]|nr:NCS2 family permease [Acholeplasmatales bacterium]